MKPPISTASRSARKRGGASTSPSGREVEHGMQDMDVLLISCRLLLQGAAASHIPIESPLARDTKGQDEDLD